MLRTGTKTTTLIEKYKEENTETESQTEVDNGVHPLHWATSLGPSPMVTNPINLLKWYKMVLESTSATVNRMLYKVFKISLLEITKWPSKGKEAKS